MSFSDLPQSVRHSDYGIFSELACGFWFLISWCWVSTHHPRCLSTCKPGHSTCLSRHKISLGHCGHKSEGFLCWLFFHLGFFMTSFRKTQINFFCQPNIIAHKSLCAQLLSYVWFFVTPWTVADQAQTPLMGLTRQEYWSGLSLPSPTRVYGIL